MRFGMRVIPNVGYEPKSTSAAVGTNVGNAQKADFAKSATCVAVLDKAVKLLRKNLLYGHRPMVCFFLRQKGVTVVGVCALCKKKRQLKRSHILPQGLYKKTGRSVVPHESNLTTLDFEKDKSFTTSRQHKEHLLCSDCEDLLNRGGENYSIPLLYDESGFGLRDKLNGLNFYKASRGQRIWHESTAREVLDINKIKHFVAGILWKHSVCGIDEIKSNCKHPLGNKFEVRFQDFLLGKEGFPDEALIRVYVDKNAERYPITSFPTRVRISECGRATWVHSFFMPGVRVRTLVGGATKNARQRDPSDIVFYEWTSEGTECLDGVIQQVTSLASN